jgi:hypothetical protein
MIDGLSGHLLMAFPRCLLTFFTTVRRAFACAADSEGLPPFDGNSMAVITFLCLVVTAPFVRGAKCGWQGSAHWECEMLNMNGWH